MRDWNDINIEYADIDELVRHGGVPQDVEDDHKPVLLNKYLLASDTDNADSMQEYCSMPWFSDVRIVCLHNEVAAAYLLDECGFGSKKVCSQWVYTGDEFDLDAVLRSSGITDDTAFRPLNSLHADRIADLLDEDYKYIERRIHAGAVTGLYAGRTLAGFAGIHEAGSIGMLYIYPRFRRHGFARLLLCNNINKQLQNGSIPFVHIADGNEASEQLIQSLGFVKCEQPVIWIYR